MEQSGHHIAGLVGEIQLSHFPLAKLKSFLLAADGEDFFFLLSIGNSGRDFPGKRNVVYVQIQQFSPRPKLSGKVKTFDVLYLYQDTVAKLTISHMTRQNNIYICIYIQYILIYSTIHSHSKRVLGVEQVVQQGGVILKNKKLHILYCAKLLQDPNSKIPVLYVASFLGRLRKFGRLP